MSDLIDKRDFVTLRRDYYKEVLDKLKAKEAEIERLTEIKDLAIKDSMAEADENEQLQAEIERLRTLKHAEYRVSQEAQRQIERLQAVVDAARHLLAGGDKKAVYHLEKALAALEDK